MNIFKYLAAISMFFMTVFNISAQNSPFYEGNGGSDIRIAVLQPKGNNIGEHEQWLLRLVQSALTADFNKYTAMTVIDRQNLDSVLGEQNQALSGNYSDDDFISIGNLVNAKFILAGAVTKTTSGFNIELSITDAETGVRKASFSPRNCTLDDLQSTAIVKQAGEDLLSQMGVTLTEIGIQALRDSVSTVPQAAVSESAEASSTVTNDKGESFSFKDYLSITADRLYEQGQASDALYYYRNLSYYFPWYYKGWLGIVRCYSNNYADFDFIDSELFMERASITASTNAEKQEVQKARTAFDNQWPRIAELRQQRAVEDAVRRDANFHRMKFRSEGSTLVQFSGNDEEVIVPPEITVIGDAAFRQNGRIKRVVLHNKVTAIGRNAFQNCSALTEIIIPASVTSIGSGAFNNCGSLIDITIPAKVSVLPDNVFLNCKSLQSVTIGLGVQRIEKSFQNCESLTAIVIPRSVTSIGDFAFSGCKNLATVTLLNANVTIGRRAFMNCPLSNKEQMIERFGGVIFN